MMKNINAIIIDDEQDAIDYLKNLLADFPDVEVCAETTRALDAVNVILDHHPDVIFLDIQMPSKDGMEILKELRQHKMETAVIFTTAFDSYAIEALRQSAFDYLLKPVNPDELKVAMTRLKAESIRRADDERMENLIQYLNANKKLRFNTRTGFILLNSSDIVYIESDRNYSTIFLKDGNKEVITLNLGTIEDLLPAHFHRISRFHIINTDLIHRVDRKKHLCLLTVGGNNFELPVNLKNIRGLEENIP